MSAFLNKLKHSEKSSTDEPLNSKGPLTTLGARVVNPEATDVLLDIVFVHGLTGDRERTWTAAQASKCWPELLLTQDLPQARIIMYGYDADVVNFWNPASQNRIADHSQKLLTSLANLRERTGPRDRPLLFVAHSLGGLVVEDALLHARGSADAHTQRVLECARGVVFLGTPHCGAGLAAWAVVGSRLLRLLGKPVNQSTLEALRPQSEVMARIRRDFHTMLRAREEQRKPAIAIVCFFEELVTPALGEKVVPDESAKLDRFTSTSIHTDHSNMTKFASADNVDYQNVVAALERMMPRRDASEEAPEALIIPPQSAQFDNHTSAPTGAHAAAVSEQPTSTTGGILQQSRPIESSTSPAAPSQSGHTFSGKFDSGGGKQMIGAIFNSGGGTTMNF